MTVIAARAAVIAPQYVPFLDQAVSDAAGHLRDVLTSTRSQSHSWTEQKTETGEHSVVSAARKARASGITVSQLAIDVASALIWALPQHVPLPQVVVEDDSEIALDWNDSSDRNMTLTIARDGYIGYSALVGLRPDYGRAPFAGSLPDTVRFNLLRVYPLPSGARPA